MTESEREALQEYHRIRETIERLVKEGVKFRVRDLKLSFAPWERRFWLQFKETCIYRDAINRISALPSSTMETDISDRNAQEHLSQAIEIAGNAERMTINLWFDGAFAIGIADIPRGAVHFETIDGQDKATSTAVKG